MSDTTPPLSPEVEAEIDATIAAIIEAGSDQPDPEAAPEVKPKAKAKGGKKKDEAPDAPEAVDDQALPENVAVEDQPAPSNAPPPTNATVVDVSTRPAKRKPFVWVVTYAHDSGREVVLEYDNLDTYKVKKGARALLMSGDRPMEA